MSCDDAGLGAVLAGLLARSREAGPTELPGLVREAARGLGADGARVHLVDVQQRRLVLLSGPGDGQSDGDGGGDRGEDGDLDSQIDIEGTLGGRAYRLQQTQLSTGPSAVGWFPLVDGVERIGVLRIEGGPRDEGAMGRYEALAALVALLVVSKGAYSDFIVKVGRRRRMSLQAELLWSFLPPRTIGTRHVTSSAVLEPAYDVGGDAFDHSVTGGRLHVSVFDAMGHDLASGGASAVALAACRSTRRAGGGPADIARAIDGTLARWIPERLLTAVVADLDTATGELSWVNCGHPPPLLIRERRIVPDALLRRAELPLGLGFHLDGPQPVHHARLQPGDRLLVYTDGVTEARSTSGEIFGERRLTDTLVQHMAGGDPAPEALRHLIHALVTHQEHRLRDDATILLAEWHPHRPGN
ncbi:PP2C family protein-serine/threonine phosphatase [Kitasatospora sp. NPDC048545]|uniref:PP2C family protein-serine/threonine phosphatase n=1 Tax=Kitasatospora sp. NPDC048545 TaxID=3157208 RepID=UPI0033E7E730